MLVPIILSGGNGSRLWPISRGTYPKPFIKFNGPLSLLQTTYQRALNIPNVTQIVTITNLEYYYQSKMELNKLPELPQEKQYSFLLEPIARNTAPAIILSALFVQELVNTEAILLIMPVDHAISNQAKFNRCIKKAQEFAKQELIVTFGIIPNKAEIGYGYIEYADYCANYPYQVKKFHEKPTLKKAKAFIEKGNYLWNSGIFCFSANTILKAIKKHNPVLFIKILDCWTQTKKNIFFQKKTSTKICLDKKSFLQLDTISIDYALMEKARNMTVIPADFDWSDIGSWDALNKVLKSDIKGNCIVGNAILKKSENTTIYNQNNARNRIIAAIGLKNLIIVDTPDALLVTNKAHTQNIKALVKELKSNQYERCQYHPTVYRPWGYYTVLEHEKNYKLKKIVVNPGCSLSLQMHKHRSEHWIVIQGIATVLNNKTQLILKEQESTFIPIGHKHCLSNLTAKALIVIEVQLGLYLGEDDIVRFKNQSNCENKIHAHELSTC